MNFLTFHFLKRFFGDFFKEILHVLSRGLNDETKKNIYINGSRELIMVAVEKR